MLTLSALKEACQGRIHAWIPLPAKEQSIVLLKGKEAG